MANEQMSAQEQALAMIAELRKLYMGYAVEFFGKDMPKENVKGMAQKFADDITCLAKYCTAASLMRSGSLDYFESCQFVERVLGQYGIPIHIFVFESVKRQKDFNVDTYFEVIKGENGNSLSIKGDANKHFNLATQVLDKLVGPDLARLAAFSDESISEKIFAAIANICVIVGELNNANCEKQVNIDNIPKACGEAYALIFEDEFQAAKDEIARAKQAGSEVNNQSNNEDEEKFNQAVTQVHDDIKKAVDAIYQTYAEICKEYSLHVTNGRIDEETLKRRMRAFADSSLFVTKYVVSSALNKSGIGSFGKSVGLVDDVIGGPILDGYIYTILMDEDSETAIKSYAVKSDGQNRLISFCGSDEEHFNIVTKVIDEITGPMLAELSLVTSGKLVDELVKSLVGIAGMTGKLINAIAELDREIVIEKVPDFVIESFDLVFGDVYVQRRNENREEEYNWKVENTLEGAYKHFWPEGNLTELKINVPSDKLLNLKKLQENCSSRNEALHEYESAVVLLECRGKMEDPRTGEISEGSAKGSGLIISQDGYVLTCAHCVGDLRGITFEEKNEKFALADEMFIRVAHPDKMEEARVYRAGIVSVWPGYDMAIVKILDGNNDFPYVEIDLEKDAVDDLTSIVVIGFPEGNQRENVLEVTPSITKGGVMRRANTGNNMAEHPIAQHTAEAHHGNSGGPVVNLETGKVVGLLEGAKGFADGSTIDHFYLLEYGKDFIENFNIRVFGSDEEKEQVRKYFKN